MCDQGRWIEAESFLRKELPIFEAGDSDELWAMRALFARALTGRANFSAALSVLALDLPLRLRTSATAVRWFGYRAIALARDGKEVESTADLNRAERIARARQPQTLDEVMKWRANLLPKTDPQKKIEYIRVGLRVARRYRHKQGEAELLATLAVIRTDLKQYDEAIDLGTHALSLAEDLHAESLIEKTKGNLSWVYAILGDYDNVRLYADAALALAEKLGAAHDVPVWLNQAGDIARLRGDYPAALAYYRKGVALAKQQKHPDTGEYVGNLAVAQLESGDLKNARASLAEAALLDRQKGDADEELRVSIIDARIDAAEGDAGTGITKINILATTASTMRRWEAEARMAEFCELASRRTDAERHFRIAIETADKARRDIKGEEFRLPFGALVRETYDAYIAFLLTEQRVAEALSVAETSRSQNLEEALDMGMAPHRADPRQVARQRHAVVLSYWLARTQSYVWLATPTSIEIFSLPPAETIERAIEHYSTEIQKLRAGEQGRIEGASLYRMLVQPVEHRIPRGAHVIVVPDGRLHAFNMETLIDSSGHYWVEKVTIDTAGSLELLGRPGKVRAPATMLLIGDPPSPTSEFPKLAKGAQEVELVQHRFSPNCKTLKGREATARAYESSNAGGYGFIHFVAHGIATRQRPLDSAVILARDGDSYKLNARDILNHRLHARLVTISSCHGAGARAYTGEGLVGLAWAFLHAGAQQVIAALWEVDDNATPKLMDELYAGIRAGREPAVALRDAKLRMIRSGGPYRMPRYWAPFVLYSGS